MSPAGAPASHTASEAGTAGRALLSALVGVFLQLLASDSFNLVVYQVEVARKEREIEDVNARVRELGPTGGWETRATGEAQIWVCPPTSRWKWVGVDGRAWRLLSWTPQRIKDGESRDSPCASLAMVAGRGQCVSLEWQRWAVDCGPSGLWVGWLPLCLLGAWAFLQGSRDTGRRWALPCLLQ